MERLRTLKNENGSHVSPAAPSSLLVSQMERLRLLRDSAFFMVIPPPTTNTNTEVSGIEATRGCWVQAGKPVFR